MNDLEGDYTVKVIIFNEKHEAVVSAPIKVTPKGDYESKGTFDFTTALNVIQYLTDNAIPEERIS